MCVFAWTWQGKAKYHVHVLSNMDNSWTRFLIPLSLLFQWFLFFHWPFWPQYSLSRQQFWASCFSVIVTQRNPKLAAKALRHQGNVNRLIITRQWHETLLIVHPYACHLERVVVIRMWAKVSTPSLTFLMRLLPSCGSLTKVTSRF